MSEFGQGMISFFFGREPVIIHVLLLIMAIDYITGVCAAIFQQKLSSLVGYQGILKKVGIICLVVMSHILGRYVLEDSNVLRNATAMFYISNELISVLENATRLGLPLPPRLKEVFAALEGKDKNKME